MAPTLALLLCTGFVAFLLRLERNQAPDVSPGLWLPTLWMLSVSTKPLAIWFSYAGGDEYRSPLDQYFIMAVICLGLIVLARRRFDCAETMRDQPWLMLFVGYMFLTLAWSDLPFTCFKRLVRQSAALLMALVVISERHPRQGVESILRRVTYILVPVSVLLIKYFPRLGAEYGRWTGERMWVGVATQKNGLARVCIIAILFLIWELLRRWRRRDTSVMLRHGYVDVLILLVALTLLLNPEGKSSATSIIAVCAGTGTLLGLTWLQHYQKKVPFSIVAVGVVSLVGLGIAFPLSGGSLASGLSEALGRGSTFTGRAETWSEIVPLAMRHPILGCGFDSYWTPMTRELHQMSNAHSAYLELFNELGVVGLLFFAFFVMSFARNAHSSVSVASDWGSLCIAFLVMALVHGYTESSINTLAVQITGTMLFLAVSCRSTVARLQTVGETGGVP